MEKVKFSKKLVNMNDKQQMEDLSRVTFKNCGPDEKLERMKMVQEAYSNLNKIISEKQ